MRNILKLENRIVIVAIVFLGDIATPSWATPCDFTQVTSCTWAGNNVGFFAPGDTGAMINFETLPNGNPSQGGVYITPAFNYVLQGAFFTTPVSNPFVAGNSQSGFSLHAYSSNPLTQNSIAAELSQPERGIGVYVIDHTTLTAYDENGVLITSVSYNGFDAPYFLGIKALIPIARVVIDRHSNSASLDDFTMIHVPVPEPASAAILLLATPILFRRARRRWK